MTEHIKHQVMGTEHMLRQPLDKRYALYCYDAFSAPSQTDCDTKSTMGFMGNFEDYMSAREEALPHIHDAIIRFYSMPNSPKPSEDFLAYQEQQK